MHPDKCSMPDSEKLRWGIGAGRLLPVIADVRIVKRVEIEPVLPDQVIVLNHLLAGERISPTA